MTRQSTAPVFVSRNHLEGSFSDVPLDALLAACFRHLVTGAISVEVGGVAGRIELRAGAVDRAEFGGKVGNQALGQMRQLVDGFYEVTQRLPDLTGELGGSAVCEGDVEGVPLIALMRHCEYHALTCTITVVSRFDRAQIEYHAGEIKRVELNGFYDDDAIVQVLDWTDARFRVSAPALDLDIQGWPRVRRQPTRPFELGERFARGTSPSLEPLPEQDAPVAARRRRVDRDPTVTSLPPPPPEPSVIGSTPVRRSSSPGQLARPTTTPPRASTRPPARGAAAGAASAVPVAIAPASETSGFTVPAKAEVLPTDQIRRPRRVGRKRRAAGKLFLAIVILAAAAAALYLFADQLPFELPYEPTYKLDLDR